MPLVEWFWLVGLGLVAFFLLSRGGFGRMPGDVRVSRPGFTLQAPMGTSCLISVVLSVVLSLGLSVCANSLFR